MNTAPLTRLLEMDTAAPDAVAASAPAPRLLIVDDIEDNRIILGRRFERRGFAVAYADGGVAALKLIDEQTFDLVLLDVMMPDIDGTTVLRTVRAKHSSTTLPIIMVTARAMSEDVVEALQLGADDYVTKPVDFAVALARVNTQLSRRRAELFVMNAAKQLSESNETLERKVLERTRDLVRVNAQLTQEIEQRELSEAETRFLARHDPLTGLGNRTLFAERMQEQLDTLMTEQDMVGLLCIDLDGFKSVNDTLGHPIGDGLLRDIAVRIQNLAPEGATVARLGGDEFALLLPNPTTTDGSVELARSIVAVVASITKIGDADISVGASIGIAFARLPECDTEELMRNADLALYRAKSEGRGTWRVFDAGMDASVQVRRQLEIDLRRAITHGDFQLYFQPIVDLATMRITSFEALLRWYHPTRGMVSPAEFIPIVEETGLIVPLGDWAIREACKHAATWPSDIRVAVNLSPVQLVRGNVVGSVVSALAATGLQPDRFELEVTESALMECTDQTLGTLNQLREIGVRLSMDDFGTGYSSLNYIRSFQFDKIKIDRSFVQDIQTHEQSRAIVAAITQLSDRFGIQTTAEGVETQQQLDYIIQRGCTEVQGRLFSMPVPADEVSMLIDRITSSWTPEPSGARDAAHDTVPDTVANP